MVNWSGVKHAIPMFEEMILNMEIIYIANIVLKKTHNSLYIKEKIAQGGFFPLIKSL